MKISVFMALFNWLRSYSARTEVIFLSLTYNPLTISLSSLQLLNADVKAREAADTILKSLV